MDTLSHILHGFNVALLPVNLFYTFLGCLMGTIIGVLPAGLQLVGRVGDTAGLLAMAAACEKIVS